MTFEELLTKVPPQFRPLAARYAPALVKMTAEEFCAWLELLILGRTYDAWEALVEKLDDAGLMEAWRAVGNKWDEANVRNADRLDLQRQAVTGVLKVLLAASLAWVGL